MRSFAPILVAFLFALAAHAEDAAELEAKGIAALKLSQVESDAIISAAIYFGQASDLYQSVKNDEKATEMNSFLYWCKKKMTSHQIDEFLKGGSAINAKIAQRMKEIEAAPPPDEAQTYFNRAEAYANAHPNEHLLIAVRFYEVADRFKGTDLSLQAQDRLLKEITLEKTGIANAGAKENPIVAPPEPGKKVAMPAAAKQKESEKTIKDLYKEEFAKTTPKDKAALAAKLDKQADESANDPAARYVLLTQAAALAAQAGELERLTAILDKLAAGFESDFKDFKKTQLSAAMSKISDAKLAKVASAMKALIDKPDDAAANLIVGKYKIQAGDIEHAAVFISKSKNAALIELMKQEQAASADGTAQAALGDAWWELGEKTAEKEEKLQFDVRAKYWYSRALPSLSGLIKAKLEKRIEELDAFTGKVTSDKGTLIGGALRGKPIDLLRQLNVKKDSVAGTWRLENGVSCSGQADRERIQLPDPGVNDYDLHVVFTRLKGNGDVGFILVVNGRQVLLSLSGWSNSIAGFNNIDGKPADSNDSRKSSSFQNNKPYDVVVQVRGKVVRTLIDSKELFKYEVKGSMSLDANLHDAQALGLYCNKGPTQFTVVEIVKPE